MSRTIISEGKTTNEAIEKGLKELKLSRNQVEIKVIEESKRSFFDILAPRVVKVEITVNDEEKNTSSHKKTEKTVEISKEVLENIKNITEEFLKKFLSLIADDFSYEIKIEDSNINVEINGEKSGLLIGHRGDTLNALQQILTAIINKDTNSRVKVYLNIDDYKKKREKSLEDLAMKVSKTVLRTGKAIKLEPMNAYERKIIHTKLQDVENINTYSIGEEPHRRIVIEKSK